MKAQKDRILRKQNDKFRESLIVQLQQYSEAIAFEEETLP